MTHEQLFSTSTEASEQREQGFGERTEEERNIVLKISERLAEDALRKVYGDREGFARERVETKRRFFIFLEESFDVDRASEFRGIFEGVEGEKDLELLTLIRLYGSSYRPDRYAEELFRHSLGVFRIGAEVFSDVLVLEAGGGKAFVDIKGRIQVEMGKKSAKEAERDFLRACLIHDGGKITIPEAVTYNSISDEESREELRRSAEGKAGKKLLLSEVDVVFARLAEVNIKTFPVLKIQKDAEGGGVLSQEDRRKACAWLEDEKNKRVRVSPHMPVGALMEMDIEKQQARSEKKGVENGEPTGVAGESRETVRGRLTRLGINPDAPLGAVIDQHEARSGVLVDILDHHALSKKLIVERHHNKDASRYHPFASGHVNGYRDDLPFADTVLGLIGAIDKFEARGAERSYKPPMPFEEILSLTADESKDGSPELKKVAAYFISSRIKRRYGASSSKEQYERWQGDATLKREAREHVEDFLVQTGAWMAAPSSGDVSLRSLRGDSLKQVA